MKLKNSWNAYLVDLQLLEMFFDDHFCGFCVPKNMEFGIKSDR